MPGSDFWGMVAGIIALAAFVPYVITTLYGSTKPNRATWFIWAIAGFMLAVSYYSSVADHTFWVPISYFLGPLVIALFSLRYGEGGWDRFDRTCLVVTSASALLWWVFSSPFVALLINLGIEMTGTLPTFRKTYREPASENVLSWSMFLVANTINLYIAESWTSKPAIYPIVVFLGSASMVTFILWRRYRHKVMQ